MKQKPVKLYSKNKKEEHIIVEVKNNEILKNKQGMVPVGNHPMNVNTISVSSLISYYSIPKELNL